jgi:hypothetical protein
MTVILLIRPVGGNSCAVRGSATTDADYHILLLLLAVVPGLKNNSCRICSGCGFSTDNGKIKRYFFADNEKKRFVNYQRGFSFTMI